MGGCLLTGGSQLERERERERAKRDTCGKRLKLSFFVLKSCLELDPFLLNFTLSKLLTSRPNNIVVINFSTCRFG